MEEQSKRQLEHFLMDIDVLDELNEYVSSFNALETLGIVHTEIRHSNVLGWLLDPKENHGFQDEFLKRFIQGILYTYRDIPTSNLTLFDVTEINFNTFYVRREWKHIDLFLYSDVHKIVFAIENKVWSKESKNQLKTYKSVVESHFPDYEQIYLFLTPDGEAASDAEHWLSITYTFVLDTIEKVLEVKDNVINKQVKDFIHQYRDVIRRHIVGDNELEEICRKIYLKHQKALDLIYEYKPDIFMDIAKHVEKRIATNDSFILDTASKTYIRFTSNKLDELIPKIGSGWTSSKRLLLFEFQNKNNQLSLKFILGPGDQDARKAVHQFALQNKNIFKQTYPKITNQYTQLLNIEFLPKNFDNAYDSVEEILTRIDTELKKFIETDLVKVEKAFEEGNLSLPEYS